MSNPPNPHQHQRTPSSSALMSLVTTASSYLTHRRAASYDKNMTSSTITTATATSTASTSTSITVTSTSIATSTSNESVPSNMTGSSLEKGGALTNVANKTTLQSNNNNNTTNYNISTNNSSKSSGNSSSNSNNSNNQNSNSSNTSTHTSSHSQSHSHHLNSNQPPQILFKGTLYKWTNYITGWQPRFFVIQGHPDWSISYYMNEDQYAKSGPSAIRSFLPLIDVIITVASDSVTDFSVYNKSEAYYLKANDKSERKQWVLALGSAKSQVSVLERISNNLLI